MNENNKLGSIKIDWVCKSVVYEDTGTDDFQIRLLNSSVPWIAEYELVVNKKFENGQGFNSRKDRCKNEK